MAMFVTQVTRMEEAAVLLLVGVVSILFSEPVVVESFAEHL